MTPTPILTARGYALLTLGWALFTVYGSLVPFHFHERPWGEAVASFRWVLENRTRVESRSDGLANALLGLPLGFGLLATLRVDRGPNARSVLWAALLLPLCAGFAAAVEFAQLYFPGRTCSGSDILMQTLGSGLGMLGWLLFGPPLTRALRQAWDHPRVGTAGRLLIVYCGVVVFVELLPLDIATSPADWYRRVRDGVGDGRVTLVPFEEWRTADRWGKAQSWLEHVGLYLPAGLLLAASRFRGGPWRALGLGVTLALCCECAQLVVSRHPSVTDMILGAAGVVGGWAAGRLARRNFTPADGLRPDVTLALGQLWLAVLLFTHWQPFDFGALHLGRVVWVPFADLVSKGDIDGLEAGVKRLVMFTPLGALAVAFGRPRRAAWWLGLAAGVGFSVAGVLELGQAALADRVPATTELVTGALGAGLGGFVLRQFRTTGEAPA